MTTQAPGLSNTVVFTIATKGYVPFVTNLSASMERLGLDSELHVYCLDDEAQEELARRGLKAVRFRADQCEAWSDYGTRGFATTVSFKYAVALEIFEGGQNALFVDSDIVFLRNPVQYLDDAIAASQADLVLQFESPKDVYNTGFWFARANSAVKDLFGHVTSALHEGRFTCDQDALNAFVAAPDGPVVEGLDPVLFACGNQFLDHVPRGDPGFVDPSMRSFDRDSAYLLHFNYLVGKEEKVEAMIRHGVVFDSSLTASGRRPARRFRLLERFWKA